MFYSPRADKQININITEVKQPLAGGRSPRDTSTKGRWAPLGTPLPVCIRYSLETRDLGEKVTVSGWRRGREEACGERNGQAVTLPHAALLFVVLQAKHPALKSPIFFWHVSLPLMPMATSRAAAGDPSRQPAQAGGLPETLVWCPCVHTSPWTSWPVQQPGDPGEVPVVLLGILQSNCPYDPSHPNPKPGHPACPWAIRSEDQSRAGSFARYFPCRCLSSPQHAGRRAASTG